MFFVGGVLMFSLIIWVDGFVIVFVDFEGYFEGVNVELFEYG